MGFAASTNLLERQEAAIGTCTRLPACRHARPTGGHATPACPLHTPLLVPRPALQAHHLHACLQAVAPAGHY